MYRHKYTDESVCNEDVTDHTQLYTQRIFWAMELMHYNNAGIMLEGFIVLAWRKPLKSLITYHENR